MIKVKEMKTDTMQGIYTIADVVFYADTKSEVTNSATLAVLPDNYKIAPGSVVYTKKLEVGVYTSNNEWYFAE